MSAERSLEALSHWELCRAGLGVVCYITWSRSVWSSSQPLLRAALGLWPVPHPGSSEEEGLTVFLKELPVDSECSENWGRTWMPFYEKQWGHVYKLGSLTACMSLTTRSSKLQNTQCVYAPHPSLLLEHRAFLCRDLWLLGPVRPSLSKLSVHRFGAGGLHFSVHVCPPLFQAVKSC